MENLGSFGEDDQVSTPDQLKGCEYCSIAVTCSKSYGHVTPLGLVWIVYPCLAKIAVQYKLIRWFYAEIGGRASHAIKVLLENGFKGEIVNGRGSDDWTGAGFELVNSTSVDPPCKSNSTVQTQCKNKVLAAQGSTSDKDMEDQKPYTSATGTCTILLVSLTATVLVWLQAA